MTIPVPRSSGLWGRVVACLAAAVLAAAAAAPVAAAPQWLVNGSVTPGAGTTGSRFVFQVEYIGPASKVPTVTASVGATTVVAVVAMSAQGGGVFQGASFLPAGTWDVTFEAVINNTRSTTPGPTVTVTPVTPAGTPLPTTPPGPTPPPTAAPTPPSPGRPPAIAPTPLAGVSASVVPSGTLTPRATPTGEGFVGGVVATASPTAQPAPGGLRPSSDVAEEAVWTLLAGGMIGISVLALLGVAALLRRRRGDAIDARIALLPPEARAVPSPQEPAKPRPRAEWEASALDDLPIGTVEYEPPPRP